MTRRLLRGNGLRVDPLRDIILLRGLHIRGARKQTNKHMDAMATTVYFIWSDGVVRSYDEQRVRTAAAVVRCKVRYDDTTRAYIYTCWYTTLIIISQ